MEVLHHHLLTRALLDTFDGISPASAARLAALTLGPTHPDTGVVDAAVHSACARYADEAVLHGVAPYARAYAFIYLSYVTSVLDHLP